MNEFKLYNNPVKDDLQISSIIDNNQSVSSISKFSDDTWDLQEYVHKQTCSITFQKINFSKLLNKDRLYIGVKEFLYAELFSPVKNVNPIKVPTAVNHFNALLPFIFWCRSQGILCFNQLTTEDFAEYAIFLKYGENNSYSSARIIGLLNIIKQMYNFNEKLSFKIHSSPYKNKNLRKIAGAAANPKNERENKTPVIPDAFYFPLMREAYNYVVFYSDDILRASGLLKETIKHLEAEKKKVALSPRTRKWLKKFNSVFGRFSFADNPDSGQPWKSHWTNFTEIEQEISNLETASKILILGLSGMRPSEFLSLKTDCVSDHTKNQNGYGRIYLNGITYKGKPEPESVSWVINEPVKKAVEIYKEITRELRELSGKNDLALSTGNSRLSPFVKPTDERVSKIDILSSCGINKRLNRFADSVCSFEENWRFNTRQFRRSLAHNIAKRPFGIIAGMMQFKHVETHIFEGYAGSDPSFISILNKERSLASIDFIDEVMMDVEEGNIAGPKGIEIAENFRGVAGDKKNKGIEYYIKNQRRNVYSGMFSYCFFDSDKAICLKNSAKKNNPILNSCRPDLCKNSCITKKHVKVWTDQINDAKEMMGMKGSSSIQKTVLKNSIQEMERAIKPIISNEG